MANARAPFPAWVLRLAERICVSDRLDLVSIIRSPPLARQGKTGAFLRHWLALEAKFAARPEPAACPNYLRARNRLVTHDLSDTEDLQDLELDVIIDLTGDFAQRCPAKLARHGVWFLDFITPDAGVAALQAIIAPEPFTRIALFRQSASCAEPTPIATGIVNTKFVAARNGLFMSEKAVALVIRELERTHEAGQPCELAAPKFNAPIPPSSRQFSYYVRNLAIEATRRASERSGAKLGLRPGMFFLKSTTGDFLTFDPAKAKPQPIRRNEYHADPFLWERDGRLYCFFETYDYQAGKGHISVGQLDGDGFTEIGKALEADYHLSFPFPFEVGGQLYMMPETCEARRVEIWRCTGFPDKWELYSTALEGNVAADSTLVRIRDAWWLFTNMSSDPFGDLNSELYLFKVDGPDLTSLSPHPMNPVVFDSRTARNAGRIISHNGIYYRPSQNNSHGLYGYGLNLMRIDRISSEEYSETLVRRILPDFERGIIGCHHLDARAGRIVMDVRKGFGGLPLLR